jgi:tRNA dimethylallyltransferase
VPPLLVIVGETASGKSALAMELAKRLDGELICADSWTVYKGFDIGTAKPTAKDQATIPHHLLDVAHPAEGFSAAIFKRLAFEAIDDIHSRGKLPIMVGGSGLYIDSVIYDYGFLPASDPALRAELNTAELPDLLEKAEAMKLDLSSIDTRNKRRVIRLIENEGRLPTKQPLRPNTLIIGIRRDAADLEQRIIQRIDDMVASGFASEVKQLGERYGWDVEPMKAPGYRAFADYLRGTVTLEQARKRNVQNDLQLAKKQRTWFKRNNSIHWLNDRSKITEIVELITTELNK